MEKQATQNIQDAYLNTARRDKLTAVFNLMNGDTLAGKIKSFDKFSVLIDVDGQEYLLFKHAISTVSTEKPTSNNSIQVKYLGRKTDNS